jgi:type I restriction enzyme S subunit
MSWKTVRLGDVATFANGYAFKPSDWSETGLEIIRIQNLTKGSSETNFFKGSIPEKYKVVYGDILISWSATLDIFVWNGTDAWLNQHIFKVVFDKVEIDKNYFIYAIKNILDDMRKQVHGATMQHITKGKFDNLEIPLPPLATQKGIAEILDAADVLRRKDQELLKKYDELAQAIFIDMFGDPVKNEKGWEVIKLENVCNKITDGEHINPEIVPEGKPLIMAKDIRFEGVDFSDYKCVSENDFIKFTKKCNPQKGDLILVSRGATIGRCCVVDTDKEFCIMGSTILIKANQDLNTSYLNQLFKIENFKNKLVNVSSASAQQAIYISHVKELNIPIPPIEKQLNFHERLRAIKNQIIKSSDVMNQSNFLFNSLIQKAFKGELVQTVKQTQC